MTSIADNGELKFADAADSRYTMFNNSGYGSSLYMADYFINFLKTDRIHDYLLLQHRLPAPKKQEKPLQISQHTTVEINFILF
jgi:hypothetical protein